MSALPSDRIVEQCLAKLAEIMRLWQSYFPDRREASKTSDLEALRDVLLKIKSNAHPWPEILDPTYRSVLDIIVRTEVAQRATSGDPATVTWWDELVERAGATAAHIQRMQQSLPK